MISPDRPAGRLRDGQGPAVPAGDSLLRTLHLGGCHVEVRVREGAPASPAALRGPQSGNGAANLEVVGADDRAPAARDSCAAVYRDADEHDLDVVEARARGMADGLRVVLERSRGGTRSLSEISSEEPNLREALERAGASHGRRIWFLGMTGRRMWPDEIQCVAGCYEVLADAAGLLRCVERLRGLDYGRRKEAYELAAQAQSALRKALRELAGLQRGDEDQKQVFDWLHDHVVREGIYIQRYMRWNDPADPWGWQTRRTAIRSLRSRLREALWTQRQVDELVGLVSYHAGRIRERLDPDRLWRDWGVIDQAVGWLVKLGAAAASPALRAALAGLARRLPAELALSPELAATLEVVRRPLQPRASGRVRERRRGRAGRYLRPRSLLRLFQEAEARYPDRIAYHPNNHSDRDYPYDRPHEVAAAVEWLVGPYWETRAGVRRADHRELDHLLKQTCGWTYKTSQSPSTVGQFRSWYETTYEGRRLGVLEHIGRGNTKRQGPDSIRIGFTWDDVTQRVVIGFVGQHQRNRDS